MKEFAGSNQVGEEYFGTYTFLLYFSEGGVKQDMHIYMYQKTAADVDIRKSCIINISL